MATLVTLGLSKILGKVGEPTALNFTERAIRHSDLPTKIPAKCRRKTRK